MGGSRKGRLTAVLVLLALPAAGMAADPGPDDAPDIDIDVIARKLDAARSQIQPSLGATTFSFDRQNIEAIPQGDAMPLNQLLLQAPGVAQDSFGQLHVRGDHANVQYRLDGVQLPEGLAVFGQALETRFAHSMSLITGALPAQYGFRQAGVIDIQTKSGITDPGGEISFYGGSRGMWQPSFSYGGRSGPVDYFITGDYLHSGIGIENPTGSRDPIHDNTEQFHGLAHISGIIDQDTRVSLLAGSSDQHFQIPNNPGQMPRLGLSVNGISNYNSASLDERQREITRFGILSLQKHLDDLDLQVSAFTRYSSLYFSPDVLGDLLFNGIAQNALRQSIANGVQTDGSWRISEHHTLRAGFLAQIERTSASTTSQVLPVDASGAQTSQTPISIGNGTAKTGGLYGVYVQDEWRLTDSLTLNYGLRFDVVDQYTHENQISPRVNLVWRPDTATTLHAGYARYFTPPPFELVASSSIARFAGTTAAPEVTTNSTVKAERGHYFDIGASHEFLPGLTLGVDGYYKLATNLIDEGQFGTPVILTAFNYATADVHGVEFTSSYQLGPWSLYCNLAWSRATGRNIVSSQFNFSAADLAYIAGNSIYLDHDQRWTASAGVSYTADLGIGGPTQMSASMLGGSGLRASTDMVPNGRGLPAYATFDFSVVQKLDLGIGKGSELRLDVINVTDAVYEIRDGTGVGVGAPQYGLRRTILGGVTQRF